MAHAYENSGRMKEADHAAAYAAQAPSVPHAVHMHGHELRRLGRINEAIARFEAADKLQRDYMARERSPRSSTGITRTTSICWPRRISTPAR